MSKADQKQVEKLYPRLNKALSDLRQVQDQIRAQKLQPQAMSLNVLISKAVDVIRNVYYRSPSLNTLVDKLNAVLEKNGITKRVATGRTARFQEISHKLKKLAKGVTTPGAKTVIDDYWMETVGLTLNIDGKSYKGNIFMSYLTEFPAKYPYFKEWKEGVDSVGIPFQANYSFEDFMNQVKIPHLNAKEKQGLIAACQSVAEHYEPHELSHLTAHFSEGNVMMPTQVLNEWVNECSEKEPEGSFREFLEKRPAGGDTAVHPAPLKEGKFLYVMRTDGSLVLQVDQRGKANHLSLTGGQSVLAAGQIWIDEGKVVGIDTLSGHYRPSIEHLVAILDHLDRNGVDINTIRISYPDVAAMQQKGGLIMEQIPPGKAKEWLQEQREKRAEGG